MKIELTDFDEDFLESLQDYNQIEIKPEGTYHIIVVNSQKAGVVGFIPVKNEKRTGFVQIILKDNFRGLGVMALVEDLLAKKYNLETLLTTIKKDNLASIRTHEKSGFKLLDTKELNDLRERGFLKENELRFRKNFDYSQWTIFSLSAIIFLSRGCFLKSGSSFIISVASLRDACIILIFFIASIAKSLIPHCLLPVRTPMPLSAISNSARSKPFLAWARFFRRFKDF
ncbi:MAG TPA: GNAT family N-acetyltransferase [Candidatus Vogelbacteria bacterium]|nr:GNAT family N-acetyltransferase [Candidatus Vogelbacteria bacterium]